VPMTPHQARRDKEFKEQTDKEIEDGQRAAAAHRQVAGDGVAVYYLFATRLVCDSTMETTPTLEGNYTQMFRFSFGGKEASSTKEDATDGKEATTDHHANFLCHHQREVVA
jgi:hypothetical protein